MKVIFLDFDGVLNSCASFVMEDRKRKKLKGKAYEDSKTRPCPLNETLCHVCTSNFQLILDHFPEMKIVISSTWRELFTMDWLKDKLQSYGIDSSRVIDKTPVRYSGVRGEEIAAWLEGWEKDDTKPEKITYYVIIDDNEIGNGFEEQGKVIKTTWATGLTLEHVHNTIVLLGGKPTNNLPR